MSEAWGQQRSAPAHIIRTPVFWGLVFGIANVLLPFGFWWLDPWTVHALAISLIAAVYIGFVAAHGRPRVIAVETCVAAGFVTLAAVGVTETAGTVLVIAYSGHGDEGPLAAPNSLRGQHAVGWPPFCATVDWLVAAILAIEIAAGVNFH